MNPHLSYNNLTVRELQNLSPRVIMFNNILLFIASKANKACKTDAFNL